MFSAAIQGGGSAAQATAVAVVADALARAGRSPHDPKEIRQAVMIDGGDLGGVTTTATEPWDYPEGSVLIGCDEHGFR